LSLDGYLALVLALVLLLSCGKAVAVMVVIYHAPGR